MDEKNWQSIGLKLYKNMLPQGLSILTETFSANFNRNILKNHDSHFRHFLTTTKYLLQFLMKENFHNNNQGPCIWDKNKFNGIFMVFWDNFGIQI